MRRLVIALALLACSPALAQWSYPPVGWQINGAAQTGVTAVNVPAGSSLVAGVLTVSGGSGTVTSIAPANATLTFTPNPIVGTGTIGINLGNANTWTGAQTFNTAAVVFGAGATASGASTFDLSGSSGTFKTPTGAATIGGGASAIGMTSSAAAITITAGAASTWSTSSGALAVDAAAALNLGTSTATSVNIGRAGGSAGIVYNCGTSQHAFQGPSTTSSGFVAITPTVVSSGTQTALKITTPSNTLQTASTEVNGVNFALTGTRSWSAGAIATQREFLIQAPTYAFVSASTITTAATVSITGAPIQGTNATLTNSYALNLEAGAMHMGGTTFASLGTPANGTFIYCSDCTVANPCAGSGTGALAKRLNGAWVCN